MRHATTTRYWARARSLTGRGILIHAHVDTPVSRPFSFRVHLMNFSEEPKQCLGSDFPVLVEWRPLEDSYFLGHMCARD